MMEIREILLQPMLHFVVSEVVRLEEVLPLIDNHDERAFVQNKMDGYRALGGNLASKYNTYARVSHRIDDLIEHRRAERQSQQEQAAAYSELMAEPKADKLSDSVRWEALQTELGDLQETYSDLGCVILLAQPIKV